MMRRSPLLFLILLLFLPLALRSGEGPAPSSGHLLTTSNGLIVATLNRMTGTVESVLPLMTRGNSSRPNEPFIAGLRLTGVEKPSHIEYLRNTHVVRAEYGSLTLYYFAPFTTGERVFYVAVEGEQTRVEQTAFSWERGAAGLRTTELVFPLPGGRGRKYFLVAAIDQDRPEEGDIRPSRARLQTYSGSLLDDELQYMRMVIDRSRLPFRLPAGERGIAERCIAQLKMRQVSPFERDAGTQGRFVTWGHPDGIAAADVFSHLCGVMACSRIGLFEEARNGLRQLLGSGELTTSPGRGKGFLPPSALGLLLLSYSDYVVRSRDSAFLRETYPWISANCVPAIRGAIRPNGLIAEEVDGSLVQTAYGSIVCAAGLKGFGQIGRDFGGEEWRGIASAAGGLKQGIVRHLLVGGKFIKGRAGAGVNTEGYYDPATFEAFGLEVITDASLFASHWQVYDRRGVVRRGESPAGLRIASALARGGMRQDARRMIRRAAAMMDDPASAGFREAAFLLAVSDAWE